MGTRKAFLLHLLFVISTQFAFSQENRVIDSLKLVLQNTSNDSMKMVLMYKISWQYAWRGRYDLQLHYAEAIIRTAEKLKNTQYQAKGIYVLGSYYYSIGNYDQAIFNITRSLDLFRKCNDSLGVASAFLRLGDYQSSDHKLEAIENYKKASGLFHELGQLSDVAVIENALGVLYFDLNNYSESLKHTALSLQFSENDEEKEGLINPLNLYRMQGYYDEILQLYLGKIHKFEKSSYASRIPNIKIVIGNVYKEKGDYEKAIQYLSDGLASFTTKVPVNLLPGYEGLAKAWLMKIRDTANKKPNNYSLIDSAFINANKALQIAKRLQNKESEQQCTVLLARAYLERAKCNNEKEDLINALHLLNKIRPSIEKHKDNVLLKDVYSSMAEVYSATGDYRQAFQFSNYASRLKDSVINDENAIKIAKLRMQFEVDKAVHTERAERQKILYEEEMRHQNAIAEQKRNEIRLQAKTNYILTTSVLLFLTAFLSILFIRQRTAKNRAIEKAETRHKMTELELQSLRAQLNPHFMLNSLNAIQELILMEDNERSHIYLSAFSDLLRMLLDNADQPFISLKKEIGFLELYLSLENLRIPNLDYSIEIDPKINIEKTKIPNMMLQPYIENAIWHALMHKKDNRKLQIKIYSNCNAIIFQVEDNGVGRKKAAELKSRYRKNHCSKGMELLSKRFNLLSKEYATKVQTTVTDLYHDGEALGTLVEIIIPSFLSEKAGESFYGTYNHN